MRPPGEVACLPFEPPTRLRLPHPLILLLAVVGVAQVLMCFLPVGTYDRRTDPATRREVVVAGTYRTTAAAPVRPLAAMVAAPKGIVAGADVMLTILIFGGALALLDGTGALARLVGALVGRTPRPRTVVIVVSLTFASPGGD